MPAPVTRNAQDDGAKVALRAAGIASVKRHVPHDHLFPGGEELAGWVAADLGVSRPVATMLVAAAVDAGIVSCDENEGYTRCLQPDEVDFVHHRALTAAASGVARGAPPMVAEHVFADAMMAVLPTSREAVACRELPVYEQRYGSVWKPKRVAGLLFRLCVVDPVSALADLPPIAVPPPVPAALLPPMPPMIGSSSESLDFASGGNIIPSSASPGASPVAKYGVSNNVERAALSDCESSIGGEPSTSRSVDDVMNAADFRVAVSTVVLEHLVRRSNPTWTRTAGQLLSAVRAVIVEHVSKSVFHGALAALVASGELHETGKTLRPPDRSYTRTLAPLPLARVHARLVADALVNFDNGAGRSLPYVEQSTIARRLAEEACPVVKGQDSTPVAPPSAVKQYLQRFTRLWALGAVRSNGELVAVHRLALPAKVAAADAARLIETGGLGEVIRPPKHVGSVDISASAVEAKSLDTSLSGSPLESLLNWSPPDSSYGSAERPKRPREQELVEENQPVAASTGGRIATEYAFTHIIHLFAEFRKVSRGHVIRTLVKESAVDAERATQLFEEGLAQGLIVMDQFGKCSRRVELAEAAAVHLFALRCAQAASAVGCGLAFRRVLLRIALVAALRLKSESDGNREGMNLYVDQFNRMYPAVWRPGVLSRKGSVAKIYRFTGDQALMEQEVAAASELLRAAGDPHLIAVASARPVVWTESADSASVAAASADSSRPPFSRDGRGMSSDGKEADGTPPGDNPTFGGIAASVLVKHPTIDGVGALRTVPAPLSENGIGSFLFPSSNVTATHSATMDCSADSSTDKAVDGASGDSLHALLGAAISALRRRVPSEDAAPGAGRLVEWLRGEFDLGKEDAMLLLSTVVRHPDSPLLPCAAGRFCRRLSSAELLDAHRHVLAQRGTGLVVPRSVFIDGLAKMATTSDRKAAAAMLGQYDDQFGHLWERAAVVLDGTLALVSRWVGRTAAQETAGLD